MCVLSIILLFRICNSGFVKTIKDENDVWWFEHNGNKFITMGVNHVNNGGLDDGVGGQESAICQSRTNNSLCGDTLSFCGALGYAPYYNNTQALYKNDSHIWANVTASNLKTWGLNTISGWSSTLMEQTISSNNLYYAHLLDMGTTWITHIDGLDYDIFSAEFYNHCDEIGQKQVKPRATDEYLLGWQLDNELVWHVLNFRKFLNYSIDSNGFQRAIQYLQKEYKDNITLLNIAWNINAITWDDLHYEITNVSDDNVQFNEDNDGFLYVIATQYFNITTNAIRRYDTNHLILGVRNLFIPYSVRMALIPWVDTVDKHCYGNPQVNMSCPVDDNPCNNLDEIYRDTQKPIYIGEFSFISSESNNPNTKGARHNCVYSTQMERATSWKHYVTTLMSKKYTIGYHWWQYADEPAQGRWPDGENCNYGLVDINDKPWDDLVNMMQTVNPTLYTLHRNA
eukprot:23005_1